MRLVFNGAEPISLALCDEFMDRCAPARLSRNAMFPVYGLAEACVAVSFPPLGSAYHASHFDRHKLNAGQTVAMLAREDRSALSLVAVGGAIPRASCALPRTMIGHLRASTWATSRSAAPMSRPAILTPPEANAALYSADGWLRTGDLGAIHAGELYITGRHKEILFVNGQNYYPHDLEAVALAVPGGGTGQDGGERGARRRCRGR